MAAESLISDPQPAGCLPCSHNPRAACRAVEMGTGQGQGHSRHWGAAVGGGGSACRGTAPAEDPSSFSASVLLCVSLISPQVTLLPPLLQPGSLISKSPLLPTPSFSCNVSLDIVHNTAVSSPPCYPARQTTEWQREVMSRMAFSAKFLLKIPGKLISFSPYSAFATFFLPKLHAYLWQN